MSNPKAIQRVETYVTRMRDAAKGFYRNPKNENSHMAVAAHLETLVTIRTDMQNNVPVGQRGQRFNEVDGILARAIRFFVKEEQRTTPSPAVPVGALDDNKQEDEAHEL